MAQKADQREISIPAIELNTLQVKIIGESPLLVHNWGVKAKQKMLDKQMGKAKSKKRDPKNPVEDFIESLYWLDGKPSEYTEEAFARAVANGAWFGFPAVAFKAATVSGGYRANITKDKVSINGAFHILGDFVEITGTPAMNESMVRIGMGTADIRYRGEFPTWEAELPVQYNSGVITAEQLVNLINLGGFVCGVGEWRVEKGGMNGRYRVAAE